MTRAEAAQMIRWLRIRRDGERYAQGYSTTRESIMVHGTKAYAYHQAAQDLAHRFRHSTTIGRSPRCTNLPALRITKRKETRWNTA